MKKKLLTMASLLCFASAFGQPDGKVFTIYNQAYSDLINDTIITTQGWDDFDGSVPLGFNFSLMGRSADTLLFNQDFNTGADLLVGSGDTVNIISFFTDFIDRSTISGNQPSTVSYKTDGTGNNKIAKVQWKNLGFWGEGNAMGTLDDSVNFQLWIYEGSNTIEVHYGKSSIQTPYTDLFEYEKPVFGMGKNLVVSLIWFDWAYYVASTNPPRMDSIDIMGLISTDTLGFDTWPAEGTVFKFTNPVVGIDGVKLNDFTSVYPTVFDEYFSIKITQAGFKGSAYLFDLNGRKLLEQPLSEGKEQIETGALASGNYILCIRNAESSVFYKVVKK